jgi:hypothetical protein
MMAKSFGSSEIQIALIFAGVLLLIVATQRMRDGDVELGDNKIIYDTDPDNNEYIKGKLSYRELQLLDNVLIAENKSGEDRLPIETVQRIAKGDRDVVRAYSRWRECYELMRSSTHVVYPHERKYLNTIP